MPHDFAHTLYEIKKKAGNQSFPEEEALTVIRKISDTITLTIKVIQGQLRGPTYFVEDNGLRRNFSTNTSFEFDLTSWTEVITATGTTAEDTTQKDNGNQSLKLDMTNSSASGESM